MTTTSSLLCWTLLSVAGQDHADRAFTVQYVKPGKIQIGDRDLSDWKGVAPVLSRACESQWRDEVCGRLPAKCAGPDDLQAAFYLAWDGDYLFFAVDVVDNAVVAAPANDRRAYRGDAAELFYVESPCDDVEDFHDCALQSKPVFQLILNANESVKPERILDTHRTPRATIEAATAKGLRSSGWKTKNGWRAEARFPLAALSSSAGAPLSRVHPRVSFDVLDYDSELARWEEPCWGYSPGHVIGSAGKKSESASPLHMREVLFEKPK